ncbi:tropomodulin isoform X2 [Stomoxys calcitrans]|uniref:tropomodulin isoform X2 n=1 Tax=Stomoxys calcitrans TaxID=35570 RepID=UPI0027E3B0DF|nr:tropomodulin isoform X2 [Stomoxys calcitrans]
MSEVEEVMATEEQTSPDAEISDNVSKKEELVDETMEVLPSEEIITDAIDEDGDEVEEITQITKKVVKRTMKITETSSTTKTTTLTTPAKLYGKDLSEYDDVDVETLLAQLSPEEINILAKEVDPDDNFLPPDQRCSYECEKASTGPLNRKKLIEHINKQAIEAPDEPEFEPYVKGTVRGKKWVPPPRDQRELDAEEKISIDLGDEYESALTDATQEEIIDLAAILGFHSMMNQDQYHASLLNKGQPVGLGWDGITKSTQQKVYPMDPPNNTDVEESIKRIKEDDTKLIDLNLNNIKNISEEKLEQLIAALPENEHLEVLSLTNVGLTDKLALLLAEAIEKSKTLRVLNVETNFISPPVIVKLVESLLKCRTIEEFRASNQRSQVLGNKIEMEITDLVEKNTSLLRLGLHLEFNDARHRVAAHLQRNIDRIVRVQKLKPNLPKLILPPGNQVMEYIAPPSMELSPSPSPIPRVDYEVEVDPDNMVIRGSPITPSPSPSPSPQPPHDYDVEVDPDNMVIRGGGGANSVFDFDAIYYEDCQGSRRVSSASSSMSSTVSTAAAAVNLANDMPAYNEDLTSYKSHTL